MIVLNPESDVLYNACTKSWSLQFVNRTVSNSDFDMNNRSALQLAKLKNYTTLNFWYHDTVLILGY